VPSPGVVMALAYFKSSLSRSFLSIAMSSRNGAISSAFHRLRVRNRSLNLGRGSSGSSEDGKYVSWPEGGCNCGLVDVR